MTTASCNYLIKDGYTFTKCGEVEFADITETYIYCPNCGKKIERKEDKEQ